MAEKDELRTIAGKALADPAFRDKLLADPEGAIKEAGIELTPEQLEALKGMDREQLEAGLADLDERLTMGCWAKANTPVGGVCAWR
jgi:hypothetical protein